MATANDVITLEAQFYTLGQQKVNLSKQGFQDTAAFEWQREGESAQNALRARLDAMLAREGRAELARTCFEFLPARAVLDLEGWAEQEIFAH